MINKSSQFTDLDSFTVTINGQNMTEAVITLLIFQDIFSPVWTAQLEILDTVNAVSTKGIKAESKVKISLETKQGFDTDGKYELEMVVHEIGDRVQQSQNTVSYIIKCANEDFIKNQKKRVVKSFKKKKADEIVKSIVQDELSGSVGDKPPKPQQHKPHTPYKKEDGQRQPSKADSEIIWLAPNISPFNAISQMLKTATYKDKADFVFFTKDLQSKKYGFESLSNMMKRKPCVKFVQRPNAIRDNGDYPMNKNLEFSHFIIDHFNEVSNLSSGFRGTTAYVYDMMSKKWDKSPKGKEGDAVSRFMPKHEGMNDGGENIYDKGKDWWQSRREELFKADQNLLKIQTPGHAKAFGWLGELCEIDLPSNDSLNNPEALDDKYKGEYMIVAIGHYITKESYFVNIELANGWDKK